MPDTHPLEPLLAALAREAVPDMPEGFMESVWERIGDMAAKRKRKMRMALFLGLFAVGLGAGATTSHAPVYAQNPTYSLAHAARLSPAALLHVDR